jgi:predicted GTPase
MLLIQMSAMQLHKLEKGKEDIVILNQPQAAKRPSVHRWDSCTHRVSDAVEKFDKNKNNALTSSIEQIVWTLNYVGIYIKGK